MGNRPSSRVESLNVTVRIYVCVANTYSVHCQLDTWNPSSQESFLTDGLYYIINVRTGFYAAILSTENNIRLVTTNFGLEDRGPQGCRVYGQLPLSLAANPRPVGSYLSRKYKKL